MWIKSKAEQYSNTVFIKEATTLRHTQRGKRSHLSDREVQSRFREQMMFTCLRRDNKKENRRVSSCFVRLFTSQPDLNGKSLPSGVIKRMAFCGLSQHGGSDEGARWKSLRRRESRYLFWKWWREGQTSRMWSFQAKSGLWVETGERNRKQMSQGDGLTHGARGNE